MGVLGIIEGREIVEEADGGCKARASWKERSVDCVAADLGPPTKIGELSVAAAKSLGIPSSPRHGGLDQPEVVYELWPGTAAPGFVLQPA